MTELKVIPLNGRRFYCINLFGEFIFKEEIQAKKMFKNLYQKLKRVQKRYPEVSFMIVWSDTDSSDATRRTEKTGKPGRPRNIVIGKKIPHHFHIVATGENVTKANERFQSLINRKYSTKQTKSFCLKGSDYPAYMDKQANAVLTCGDFDFTELRSDYCVGI